MSYSTTKLERMNRNLAVGLITSLVLIGPATADAASKKSRVKSAVRSEVEDRYSNLRVTDVTCSQLTSRRFKCSYVAQSTRDDGPCRGRARATVYSRSVDVTSVSSYRCDF